MMTTSTLIAAAILGIGLYRASKNTHSLDDSRNEVPLSVVGGAWGTDVGVSPGNELQYTRDDSVVVWQGADIYGIRAQDVLQPDGSRRRVYGNWPAFQ